MTDEQMIETLRARGYTVLPPASEDIPEPAVGQVWRSSNPRIEPRTVVRIGHNGWYGEDAVLFDRGTPLERPHALHRYSFIRWAQKSGARPQ